VPRAVTVSSSPIRAMAPRCPILQATSAMATMKACALRYWQRNVLLDDEIHKIFAQRGPGVRVVLLSDSCHSGSVTARLSGQKCARPRPAFCRPRVDAADRPASKASNEIPARAAGRRTPRALPRPLRDRGRSVAGGLQGQRIQLRCRFGGRPAALSLLRAEDVEGAFADGHLCRMVQGRRDYLPAATIRRHRKSSEQSGRNQLKYSPDLARCRWSRDCATAQSQPTPA